MSDDIMKKAQEEYERIMKEMNENGLGVTEDMLKKEYDRVMGDLGKDIDIEKLQNSVAGIDMASIMKQGQEAKEKALSSGKDEVMAQAEAMAKAMNEQFLSGDNTFLQDMINEQMKQFGFESPFTPDGIAEAYKKQAAMQGSIFDEDEEFSFEGLYERVKALYEIPMGKTISVSNDDEYIGKFEILLSGILSYLNGHDNDTLDVEVHDEFFHEKINYVLSEIWGINSKDDLLGTVSWLLNEGHTDEYLRYCNASTYEEIITDDMDEDDIRIAKNGFEFAQFFKDKLPENIILGWDFGRAAMIVRWGYFMNYINEDEAWEILDDIAGVMINNFDSWRDYGISYIFGGLFWTYRDDPDYTFTRYDETVGALEALMAEGTDEGEWGNNPWINEVV